MTDKQPLNEDQKRHGAHLVRCFVRLVTADRIRAAQPTLETSNAYLDAAEELARTKRALDAATPYPDGIAPPTRTNHKG